MNDKIKLRKILRPSDLSTGQNFGSAEIFQVLVISDHVKLENLQGNVAML